MAFNEAKIDGQSQDFHKLWDDLWTSLTHKGLSSFLLQAVQGPP